MYVPELFALSDPTQIRALVQRWPFATVITAGGLGLVATHVPLVIAASGDGGVDRLIGHVARANPHWQAFDGTRQALAVFSGPHAYVSPTWYATSPAVPTWNYAAIHAYGRPRILKGTEATRDVVERLVREHDAAWRLADQPAEFVAGMLRGIVAFELPIDRLEGKMKLSQNRPAADRPGVVRALRAGGEVDRAVADHMESKRRASRV